MGDFVRGVLDGLADVFLGACIVISATILIGVAARWVAAAIH